MEDIQYLGEHLWIGQVGHIAVVLSFVAAIFSTIAYFLNTRTENNIWRSLGRLGFYTHAVSVFTIVGLLFYAMVNQYFEYAYVFSHVSEDLPMRYIVSAFWEGQEGSFLLWMMWQIVLGVIMIKKAGKWEAPVLFVFALTEVFLASMLLGVHLPIGDEWIRIGSNPTLLLRDTMAAPIFQNADYLTLIQGEGLNPLLQNYWMTIHPPVTFLGFASTIVPFAFAFAGVWKGEYREWLKPALPWALFSAGILGTGIFMGSLWAYEALSFGGYWNWDPVENAVLVPWITLIAGIHTHLIARNTGYSIKSTIFFYGISFPLIVYSTYLTRSGILGDTSAHAFTEMGLDKQLIAFFLCFFGLIVGGLIFRYKAIPTKEKEESLYSREFWMFIGALILFFSAVLIGVPTSLPVYNSIRSTFNENFVGNVIQDPVEFYNKYQLWIGILVGFLAGSTMFLRYREQRFSQRKKGYGITIGVSLILAVLGTVALTLWIKLYSWPFYLLSLAGMFALFANLIYLLQVAKTNIKLASSATSHFGFGLLLIGLLGSGLNKYTISNAPFISEGFFKDDEVNKYVPLIKGSRIFSQGYWITYESDTLIDRMRYYEVDFKKENAAGEVVENFKLYPDAALSNNLRKVAAFNPDTKHFLHKDIFSCIVSLPPIKMDIEKARAFADSLEFNQYWVEIGDTLTTENGNQLVAQSIDFDPSHPDYDEEDNDFGIGLQLIGTNERLSKWYPMQTALGLQGALLYHYPAEEQNLGIRLKIGESMMDSVFTSEEKLAYQQYDLKTYGEFKYDDIDIKLTGFNKEPEDRNYIKEEGDIAIGANLQLIKDGKAYTAEPIYVIRGTNPMGVKAYVPELGIHIRFGNINPKEEIFTFYVAKDVRNQNRRIPIEIAERVERTDYIIMQILEFPGINLFWLGGIVMMLGLFMAMGARGFEKLN